MGTDNIVLVIVSIILGMIACFCFFTACRHHLEKGFIFTNRWLFASAKDREEMDETTKKAEYRFGRNIFALIGLIFLLIAIYTIVQLSLLLTFVYLLIAISVFYGIMYLKNS